MALVLNENSYVTVAEADAYFETRVGSSWSSLTLPEKEAALVTATAFVDGSMKWSGQTLTASQTLGFPRTGSFVHPVTNRVVSMETVPQLVKEAVFDTASHVQNSGVDEVEGLTSLTVDTISIVGFKGKPGSVPSVAKRKLQCLSINGGRNEIWRAN